MFIACDDSDNRNTDPSEPSESSDQAISEDSDQGLSNSDAMMTTNDMMSTVP